MTTGKASAVIQEPTKPTIVSERMAADAHAPTGNPLGALLGEYLTQEAAPSLARYTHTLFTHVPDYARLGDDDRRRVRDAVGSFARILLHLLVEDRAMTTDELVSLDGVGVAQAELGATLPGVTEALRFGRKELMRRVEEALRSTSGAGVADALGIARHVVELFDVAASAVLDGHRRARVVARPDAKLALLELLLRPGDAPPDDLVIRGRALGCDLTRPHGLLLIVPHGDASVSRPVVPAALASCMKELPGALGALVRMSPEAHGVVVLAASSPLSWTTSLSAAARLAVRHGVVLLASGPVPDAPSLGAEYADAASLLEIARRVAPRPAVLTTDALVVYRMVSEWSPAVRRAATSGAIARFLALPAGRRARLGAAAWALLTTNESYASAAHLLGVTPKAVRKRIETLSTLTGLTFARADDRLRLWLVLHDLQLAATDTSDGESASEGTFHGETFPLWT